MPLNVLFIDDDPDRHHKFGRNTGFANSAYGPIKVTHVWTYEAAVSSLKQQVYDIIYFDFDLNDHPHLHTSLTTSMYGTIKLTGEDIALAMLELPKEQWPKRVVVHSWNAGGASILMKLFEKAGLSATKEEFHGRLGKNL